MANSELLVILQKYLPEGSADYAHDILWKYGIQLRIKKPRATKLGDYRPPQTGEAHRISINKDLNKYAFLVTFLHETAHLINFEKRGFKVQPHGLEWKQEFQVVTKPMLHETILPIDVQNALHRYLKNPKASISGKVIAKRASTSSRPASQPPTTVSASIQALMFTNCKSTPWPKPTFNAATSACARLLVVASLKASHSK